MGQGLERDPVAMLRPDTAPRLLLVADARRQTGPVTGRMPVRRFRLARLQAAGSAAPVAAPRATKRS